MAKYTPEQYARKLRIWAARTPDAVAKALQKGTEMVRTEAIINHLSGPRMPKGVGSSDHATLARRTGKLAGSLRTRVKVAASRISGTVGTNVIYAHNHEKGITVPERPFLAPSLQAKREEALQKILDTIMDEYKRA